MLAEIQPGRLRSALKRLRVDSNQEGAGSESGFRWPVARLVLIAVVFLVVGGGSREPSDDEARIGLAASEGFAPFGRVFGGWDPSLSPGVVMVSRAWAWIEGGFPSNGAIRWPSDLAAVGIGLILAFRAIRVMGPRAGVLVGLCLMSSFAMIDRSADFGIDALSGLAVVGALDRIVHRETGWIAGCWAALALAFGGWPALAIILLPMIVLERPRLSKQLLLPPIALFAVWSVWAISTVNALVWFTALRAPLTRPGSRLLAVGVVVGGLPWLPFAGLTAWKSVRAGYDDNARGMVFGWLKIAGACVLVGTLVPGFASAAKVPALAALAVAAAGGLDRVMAGSVSAGPRRTLLGLALVMTLVWGAVSVFGGAYLAAAFSYYRGLAFVVMTLGALAMVFALNAVWRGDGRAAFSAVFLVAVGLKLVHVGFFVPEINYRLGQGPWGRAIGQYVPPRWPIYTFHAWRADLAFATEHPFRQISDERFLARVPDKLPKFVLLLPSEFENWSALAPKLQVVRSFEDEEGRTRILARTEGPLMRRAFED